MIIADKRERNSAIIAELKARGINIEEKVLPIGDYIVGNTIIERKSLNDFISSMLNKRLIKQLKDLKESKFKYKLIILEGLDEQELFGRGNLNDNAIRGMILSILIDYKIPIVFTKDFIDTCNYLEVLDKRTGKKKVEISLAVKPKFSNIFEQQEFILESFPGIGKITAREILKRFGTIKAFINADEEELAKIKKLGKKAKIIKKIIESKYNS
ncbi:MAG: ERCC4 domain-containing protein [Candidatus Pacearchaeota archaeon]